MLNGDQRRLRLAYSLLLMLPGTPVLYYGDEIGMGDDLALEGRTSVRTAMQWSDESHGGRMWVKVQGYGYRWFRVGSA
jgi:maltose alpha-D-glucosyltransferase/alpha-amylase